MEGILVREFEGRRDEWREKLMSRKLASQVMLLGVFSLSIPFGFALNREDLPVTPTGRVLEGSLMTRSTSDSPWAPVSGDTAKATCFKTGTDGEAVVTLGGDVQVRLSKDTEIEVTGSTATRVNLRVARGEVFAAVPSSGLTPVHIATPNGNVRSSTGTFIVDVDAGETSLEVLQGNASLEGKVRNETLGDSRYGVLNLQAGDSAESSDDADQDPNGVPEATLPAMTKEDSVEQLVAQSALNEQKILQGTVENLTDQGFELVLSDGTRIQVNVDGKTKFYDKDSGEELNDLANGDTVEVVWENPDAEVAVEVRIGRDKFPIGAQEGTALGLGALGIGAFLALQGDGQNNGDDLIIASP